MKESKLFQHASRLRSNAYFEYAFECVSDSELRPQLEVMQKPNLPQLSAAA